MKLPPVEILVPPVATSNQDIIPSEAVAVKVSIAGPQLFAGVVELIVGTVFIVAATLILEDAQPFAMVST